MIIVVLSHPFSRKTFDIYNFFCKMEPTWTIAILDNLLKGDRVKRLYPKALYIPDNYIGFREFNQLAENRKNDTFIYLPIEEETTRQFILDGLTIRHENIVSVLPDLKTFDMVRNKISLDEFCAGNQIPVPKSYEVHEVLDPDFHFIPLIAKPKIGSGSIGHVRVDTEDELERLNMIDQSNYVIQRRLNNSKDIEGAFFLADHGKVIGSYCHKRIRTYPEDGGVTVFSKFEINRSLEALGAEILEKLNWNGLIMMEFLWDDLDADYKLIEINPRIWGSVLLSEFSGARLITKFIQLCTGSSVKEYTIKTNSFIRWLLPYDLILWMKGGWRQKIFWTLERQKTCFINISYSDRMRAVLWHIYSMTDSAKLKVLWKKIF